MALSVSERIASVKAGLIGAAWVGWVALVCEVLNIQILARPWGSLWNISDVMPQMLLWQSAMTLLFAIISGFLFGVTYRYIRRDDPNPHLRTGAIAAFGLIRGLAQIDIGLLLDGNLGLILLLAGESMMMMAIAALGLDWAIEREWIEPATTP